MRLTIKEDLPKQGQKSQFKTWGDIKKAITSLKLKRAGAAGGQFVLDAALSAIPGLESAKTAFDFFKTIYSANDDKKSGTVLDKFNVDDQFSEIVDDTVEMAFLKDLAANLEKKPDNEPIPPNYNINVDLRDYLKNKYKNRTLTLAKESRARFTLKEFEMPGITGGSLTQMNSMEEEACDCGCNHCSSEKDDTEVEVSPRVLSGIKALIKLMVLENSDDAVTEGGTYVCEGCLYEYMDSINESPLEEAEYHGRKVPLGKKMKGDVKKSKVYVRNPKTGKVIKINFGDKNMRIKKSNPKRRKSFRARHHCDNPGPRTKAKYWSCRSWN